jgi:pimeloyl-ACP methyl ester carboxylesterase
MPGGKNSILKRLGGALLLGLALLQAGCFPFSRKLRGDADAFTKAHPDGFHTLDVDGHPLRYAAVGLTSAPLVLLVHGSPGGWEAWAGLLMDPGLSSTARVLAPDRPGFGGSEPGVPLPSLRAQAARLAALLRAEGHGRKAVVLGHSLGGPIAVRLAMDDPDLVSSLILVAPSVDPAQEEEKWYQVPASWGWLRPLVPSALDVCNQEILPLKGELEAMLPLWAKLQAPVDLIQGLDDPLVPPANADFIEAHVPASRLRVLRIPGMDHFVPWRRPDLLLDAIHRNLP